jgi:hypothetical protein
MYYLFNDDVSNSNYIEPRRGGELQFRRLQYITMYTKRIRVYNPVKTELLLQIQKFTLYFTGNTNRVQYK